MEQQNIIGMIQKCLSLAESPNEHEAERAMAKAQELLLKYNMDMATIHTDNHAGESEMINEVVDFHDGHTWQRSLLNTIARRNFCQTIKRQATGQTHILGRKANVQAVCIMHNWLEPQIIRLAVKSRYKRANKTTYIIGVIERIGIRIDESKADYNKKHPESTALVINIQGEIDKWYHQQFPKAISRYKTLSGSQSAYGHGSRDGAGVSMGSQQHLSGGRVLLA